MKWLLVVLIFQAGDVVDSKIFGGASEQECNAAKAKVAEWVKAQADVQVWTSACIKMEVPKPPQPKPERNT